MLILGGGDEWLSRISLSDCGRWVATVRSLGELDLWRRDRGRRDNTITRPGLLGAVMHPSGRAVIVWGTHGLVAIDPVNLQRHPVEPRQDVDLAAMDAAGTCLIGVEHSHSVRRLVCWAIDPAPTFREVWRVSSNAAFVDQLVVSPDGRRFATAEEPLRQVVRVQERSCITGELLASGTVPTGSRLLGLHAGTVLLSDREGGLSTFALETRRAATAALPGYGWLDAAFAPDSGAVLAIGGDRGAHLLEPDTLAGRRRYSFSVTGDPTCVAFAPDGLTAACGTSKGEVVIWDVD